MDLGCKKQSIMVTNGSDNAFHPHRVTIAATFVLIIRCATSVTQLVPNLCLHCSAVKRAMILAKLPRVTWKAINMLPKHGGDASCGQAGDAAKCNIIPLSTVDWYLIRLTIASNSGEHVKSDGGGKHMDTLDVISCLASDDDAGCQMNDRSSEVGRRGTWPIARFWRPYNEPAMPKSRESMGRKSLEIRLDEAQT